MDEFKQQLEQKLLDAGVCESCIENFPYIAELEEDAVPMTLVYNVSPHCLSAMFKAMFGQPNGQGTAN